MSRTAIALIEDDPDMIALVRKTLEGASYDVQAHDTGRAALDAIAESAPGLVILDLNLPDMDGLDLCKELKASRDTQGLPLLMMSSRDDEADIVAGLELGADDYVTKPFSPRVMLARVRAVLRRREREEVGESDIIRYGDFTIDPYRFEIRLGGELLHFTKSEFRILHLFCRKPGWVFTRNQIVEAVHGEMTPVTARSVDVLIVGLRQKLGELGGLIETVRGIGYRITENPPVGGEPVPAGEEEADVE